MGDKSPSLTARYKEFDVAVTALFKKARALGSVIPCSKGCSACCSDLAIVTHFEMVPLVETLRAMAVEKRQAIKRRLIAWFARMEAAGISAIGEPDRSTYYRAQLPCPMLDPEAKTCLVYSARPVACRAHHIVDASPDVCAAVGTNPWVPSLLLNDQLLFPFFQVMVADQHFTVGEGDLLVAVGPLPTVLWAVWPLVEDRTLSISDWLAHTNRHGLKLKPPTKEEAIAG